MGTVVRRRLLPRVPTALPRRSTKRGDAFPPLVRACPSASLSLSFGRRWLHVNDCLPT